MRDQRYSPGFIAILGSLVVLSVFVLVFGTTTTMAQPGQDERCSEYTRQAKGLCTAAVANGCFDGEESQECDDLAENWNERCRVCEGEPPWLPVTCPCGSALGLHNMFINQPFNGNVETAHCAVPARCAGRWRGLIARTILILPDVTPSILLSANTSNDFLCLSLSQLRSD